VAHRITVIEAAAPSALSGLPSPHAVFIGGGLDAAMFNGVLQLLAVGTRVVAHAVTIETEALLSDLHQRHGGEMMRIEIAHATRLGRYRAFEPARPVVQWSVAKPSGDCE
jgi:precorrin-6Y C5,15-methyltransferase (decarboxylating)